MQNKNNLNLGLCVRKMIRNAALDDVDEIFQIEKRTEQDNAATKETLVSRLKMFPEGFFVAEEDNKVVGYVESCLWNKEDFETFEEIHNFPQQYDHNGRILYAIFLAVDAPYRRKGIGSQLIKTLQDYARMHDLEKVQLVAGEGFLVDFYKKLRFKIKKQLPHFLPRLSGTLMEHQIRR